MSCVQTLSLAAAFGAASRCHLPGSCGLPRRDWSALSRKTPGSVPPFHKAPTWTMIVDEHICSSKGINTVSRKGIFSTQHLCKVFLLHLDPAHFWSLLFGWFDATGDAGWTLPRALWPAAAGRSRSTAFEDGISDGAATPKHQTEGGLVVERAYVSQKNSPKQGGNRIFRDFRGHLHRCSFAMCPAQ